MSRAHRIASSLGPALLCVAVCGCNSGTQTFIGGRLANLCNESYYTCNVTAGCNLDPEHYVRGVFPGARRVVVNSEEDDTVFSVRLYLELMEAPGTELLVQLYEPDCSLDTDFARVHLEDVDVFEEAGQDRTLLFELDAADSGEHMLEIFSDASAAYLLIAEPL